MSQEESAPASVTLDESSLHLNSTPSSDGGSQESTSSQTLVSTVNKNFEVTKEYFCGVGKCRPKWMQVFRNSKFFTFILTLYCTVEGAIVSGFTSVVLSTIEKRYRFSSVWAGLIASTFDISVLVSVLFISYFGGRGHKPRWLGISLIIQGAGAFVFSLPQFVFGQYEMGLNGTQSQSFELCEPGSISFPNCDATANTFALAFFFIGNILIGVGAAPLFTVGTAYLDDIVLPRYVTIHLGIFYAFSIIGPAIGYGLGGLFLSLYVDPWVETTLEPSDPEWVGAWWMCFIFSGFLSWLVAIPFFMFPKLLPDSLKVKKEREKEMAQKYQGQDSMDEVDFSTKLKTFPQHLKLVVKTPSWIFITIAICCSLFVVSGVTAFAPKYLESQFSITASTASLLAGVVAIIGGGSGVVIGALIIYFTKSKGRHVALINWIVSLVALIPTFIFILDCPTLNLVGVTVSYPDSSVVPTSTSALNSSCITHCNCISTTFEPICGEDNLTYFSPCTAGCLFQGVDNVTKEVSFDNCACIFDRITNITSKFAMSNGTAVNGICEQSCNKLGIFLVVVFLVLILLFMLQVPNVVITVRCVADEQRTLALGAQSVAFRMFGSIPGPLVFGAIFDSGCIYWQTSCNRRGNCWVYDNSQLSQRALILAILGIGTNFIFSLFSWLFYPKQFATEPASHKEASPKREMELHDQVVLTGSGEGSGDMKRMSVTRTDSQCSENVLLDSEM